MQGLEKYCKSNLLEPSPLVVARQLLETATTDEAFTKENLEWVAKCMNCGPISHHISRIIQNAFEDYKKDYHSGKVSEEQKKYIYDQIINYNKMINEASKIANIKSSDKKKLFLKSNTLKENNDELSL